PLEAALHLACRAQQLGGIGLARVPQQLAPCSVPQQPALTELRGKVVQNLSLLRLRELRHMVQGWREPGLMHEDWKLHADRAVGLSVLRRPLRDGPDVPLGEDGPLMVADGRHAAPPPTTSRARPAPVVVLPPTWRGDAVMLLSNSKAPLGSWSLRIALTCTIPARMVSGGNISAYQRAPFATVPVLSSIRTCARTSVAVCVSQVNASSETMTMRSEKNDRHALFVGSSP